jgi:hypothetical protein
MTKLWLTYAWKDNEVEQVDFVAQELRKAGLDVRVDRVALVAGRRLWPQIAEHIEKPEKNRTCSASSDAIRNHVSVRLAFHLPPHS